MFEQRQWLPLGAIDSELQVSDVWKARNSSSFDVLGLVCFVPYMVMDPGHLLRTHNMCA